MFAGVVPVQALVGLRKPVARQIPDPHRPIGGHQHSGPLRQTVALSLGEKLIAQGCHPLPNHHRAPAQNARPAPPAFQALIQKTRAPIDPEPPFRFPVLAA